MSWLQDVTSVKQRRQSERLAAVEALVTQHVAGDLPDPDEIVRVCEDANVSLESYAEKVEARERRRELLTIVAKRSAYEARRAAAERAMKAANEKLETAQREWAAEYRPAEVELQETNLRISEALDGAAELRKTCKAPALVARSREISDSLEAAREREKTLTARQAFLTREIARLEPQAVSHEERRTRQRPANYPDPRTTYTPGDYCAEEHGRVRQALENLRDELPKVQAALAAIPAAFAALDAERESLLLAAEASPL